MFVVNISIDKIDDLYQIAAIRIKPKNTPKDGELCTYHWGLLNSKNQFKKISSFTKPSRKASSFRAGMDRQEIRNLI